MPHRKKYGVEIEYYWITRLIFKAFMSDNVYIKKHFNLTNLSKDIGGEDSILAILLGKFLENARQFQIDAKLALEEHNDEQLRQAVHKIKPNFSMIGALDAFELISELYAKCNNNAAWEDIVKDTKVMIQELSMIQIELEATVKELKQGQWEFY